MGAARSADAHMVSEDTYRTAIARIEALLSAQPAAEELASSQKLLGALYRTLDTRRPVNVPNQPRGLPLRLAVKALKNKWHADGTWPVIGYDEAEKHKVCDPQHCVVRTMHVSQHKHQDVVPQPAYERGKTAHTFLPCRPVSNEALFVEARAEDIVHAYEARAAHAPPNDPRPALLATWSKAH